ncbi:uncharacterized protein [Elaeis guineensis]|uniref:uncharacterized protein n=1 Tax=Elaeis guineensis var. tenera TaxID=51953 RepID=UPI003C6D6538
MPPSNYYPEGASALADHDLARRLCQGILLPTDVGLLRTRQVSEMLSRFYPTMVELIFTMSELEAGYRRFGNVRAAFKERSAAAEAERAMLAEQLLQSADREAKLVDEVSRLGSELQSAKKEAKHKGRAVRRLRRERDGATTELKGEREQLRTSLEKLAEAEEELSIAQIDAEMAKAEAESAREELARAEDEAVSARESAERAMEDFRSSDRYREEMLESGFASYRVGFEDGRDAVHALYPEVDVSRVVPPFAEEGAEEEGTEEWPTSRREASSWWRKPSRSSAFEDGFSDCHTIAPFSKAIGISQFEFLKCCFEDLPKGKKRGFEDPKSFLRIVHNMALDTSCENFSMNDGPEVVQTVHFVLIGLVYDSLAEIAWS